VVAQIGYVVQTGGLFPHLTAARNVTLPAEARRWPPARIRPRLAELAAMMGFDAATLGRHPAELSGGQRQRVSLMRALMLDPPVLLLDEPLGALDPIVRADLQSQLREIFARLGKTVVMVTHDVGEAALFGTTIALMTRGRIVQHGRFEDLARRPADPFVTEFLSAQAPPPELAAHLGR
jgi:osmoprotectant transport system ATP-binding protein